jgi:glycosyltransferase involved in cell wall biosynthesis
MNYFVVTPYYKGTAFEEIYKAVKKVIQIEKMDIKIIGFERPMKNRLSAGLLDDEDYTEKQAELLRMLLTLNKPNNILFLDFFNPGVDLIKYFHLQNNVVCNMGALLHGGTFLEDDLYNIAWLKNFELGWFDIYNKIYNPAEFIKEAIPEKYKNKLVVLPWGMDSFSPDIAKDEKAFDVVFPHRLNKDKGIDDLIRIANNLKDVGFVITAQQKEKDLKDNFYYGTLKKTANIKLLFDVSDKQHKRVLGQSKVILSCAKQELFGYSVMKGVVSGCYPVLPDREVYPQYFSSQYLYKDLDEACSMINAALDKKSYAEDYIQLQNKIQKLSFKEILGDFFGSSTL